MPLVVDVAQVRLIFLLRNFCKPLLCIKRYRFVAKQAMCVVVLTPCSQQGQRCDNTFTGASEPIGHPTFNLSVIQLTGVAPFLAEGASQAVQESKKKGIGYISDFLIRTAVSLKGTSKKELFPNISCS